MGDDKKTLMVLKVDLQCSCCYEKVKKVLCKFPQIKDQVYDEKAGTVTITVTCCSPEKIRDKIYCKGGKTIKSIEIKDSSKTKPKKPPVGPEKPNSSDTAPQSEKTKPPEPALEPVKPEPSNPAPQSGIINIIKMSTPVHGYPPQLYPQVPFNTCCGQCYNGMGGGPCYMGQGFGGSVPPPPGPCYDGYGYGGGNRSRYVSVSRCEYFSEENPAGCSIM